MACNVCGEETGWAENPLVYCDGSDGHCSVAVHQACYGIITVPSGAWLCGKCTSSERKAKVRCELCPNKDGAFKRTNTGNFAHVVCSLYIPEVRFGNVCTMEPIILNSIPSDRFHKNCYICEDRGRENKAKSGACMECNKPNCKQYFHVTCAQAQGLLCEEAGNSDDNVKYCGYCKHHYQKMKKDHNIKFIPAFKPDRSDVKGDSSPEKKSHRHNSDTSKPPKKKQKFYGNNLVDSDIEPEKEPTKIKRKRTSSSSKDLSSSSGHSKHNTLKENSFSFSRESLDNSSSESNITAPVNKKSKENFSKIAFDSDSTDDELQFKKSKITDTSDKKKTKKTSSKTKDNDKSTDKSIEKSIEKSGKEKKIKKRKEDTSSSKQVTKSIDKDEITSSKTISKSIDKNSDKQSSTKSSSSSSSHNNEISSNTTSTKNSSNHHVEKEVEIEVNQKFTAISELPKQSFHLPEIIKPAFFFNEEESRSQKPVLTFEELLERQWNQNSQFLMEQTFDISSLISCLYKLKSENRCLDEKLRNLTQRRDHLISVNSRLNIPLHNNAIPLNSISSNSLDNWDSSNNQQLTSTINNSIAATNANQTTLNNSNQATLAQSNFASIHNPASTPSPNQQQQQQQQIQSSNNKTNSATTSTSNNHSNFFNLNCVNNNSLNNQSFKSTSIDLNANTLNTSFFDSSIKQANSNFSYKNGLYPNLVNGQFNLNQNTSSPSKISSSFNNSLTNSTNSNLIAPQLFQHVNNFLAQNQQAFSQLNQKTVQNHSMNGSQSKR